MSTEPGEPDAGPGTTAAAQAAQQRDGGELQVDLEDGTDTDDGGSLAEDDDAAVSGPPETDKLD